MWSLQRPLLGTDHVLPPPVREEAVIAAGDELAAVLERHPVGAPHARPLRQHGRARVASISPTLDRAIDRVANLQIGELTVLTVSHQDRRSTPAAVDASVAATAIRVDRPAE